MAGLWRRWALLVLVVCSVSLSAASDVDALPELDQNFSSRKLLQAVAPTPPPATPPSPAPTPPTTPSAPAPTPKHTTPPATPPEPRATTTKATTQTRRYLMWIGIGAGILVFLSVAVFCICRKCGQAKIRGAQRLPSLPRYH